ncbi:class I SAM-dependent methyltransferase [Arenimonas malthae]|uniref:class I SAM-dependent methyltransferase n=1 Tax=Arenimonas malthae TaxID=354197 RepID=UPI003CCBA4BC
MTGRSITYLHYIRDAELEVALAWLPPPASGARILDLGAGTGRQAARLAALGYHVTAVDLPSSAYAAQRVHPVIDYDGRNIPLPDGSVDIVFSSNVLEHVPAVEALLCETARVLAPGGRAVHILPTPAWRWWTSATHYPWVVTRLVGRLASKAIGLASEGHSAASGGPTLAWPTRHGERGNALTEAWYFSRHWWRECFRRAGFDLEASAPVGLAYSGSMLLGGRLPISWRRRIARFAGSSCRIYVIKPHRAAGPVQPVSMGSAITRIGR